MPFIKHGPDTAEKLQILSQDSKYDLACACATQEDEHRRRSEDDKWIYPVTMANGRKTFLFKTLLSNHCINNCKYCPLRVNVDVPRLSMEPEELSRTFLEYFYRRRVSGIFLSSGVIRNADETMERINRTALLLRRSNFRGYIHLKIIPGASEQAVRQSISLASAVSLNVEAPGEKNFHQLSTTKNYAKDIVGTMNLISRINKSIPYRMRVKHTTQFVVGAASEADKEIVASSWKLYRKLGLNRIYFSAYQRGAGAADLPGEISVRTNRELLMREHRLYQTDWLIRKYGFRFEEIPFKADGNLSLDTDPKEMWAGQHPEFFPVNVNNDGKERLLRVPGIGEVMAERILQAREEGTRLRSLNKLGRRNKLLEKAAKYIVF